MKGRSTSTSGNTVSEFFLALEINLRMTVLKSYTDENMLSTASGRNGHLRHFMTFVCKISRLDEPRS